MTSISRDSLLSLEAYAKARKDFRTRVIPHRRLRTVHLGGHVALQFEDELTVRYQIQEMLRIERIFEEEGIQAEIDVYAPLVPGGSDWRATMLIEYPDAEERKRALARLIGIEDRVWVRVAGHNKVYAVADEDMERETEAKTSSVHFLRFELTQAMKEAAQAGAGLTMGVDHPNYEARAEVSDAVRAALVKDLD